MSWILEKIGKALDEEPFILSHHPLCERYEKHVVEIHGRKVCMGCLFTYSSAAITLLLINIFHFTGIYDYSDLFWMGILFFGLAMIRKLFLDDDKLSKNIHILFRSLLGISLGFEIGAIQYSEGSTRWILIVLVVSVMIVYNVLNTFKTRKICKTCPQYSVFPNCDGFPYKKKKDGA